MPIENNAVGEKSTPVGKVAAIVLSIAFLNTGGCTAIALVDAAASTAVGVTKVAVKGTTAAAGALIPDGDDKKKKK